MSSSNIAVIYYSATGSVHRLASAVAGGAADAGAEVRLRRAGHQPPRRASNRRPPVERSHRCRRPLHAEQR